MCVGLVFRDNFSIYTKSWWSRKVEGGITQRWTVLPRGYFSDEFLICHEKWHPCGNHLRSKPAPYASCKIPPSEAMEKNSLFPSPPHFLQLLWSHSTWGNRGASWPRFITIWEPEWDAWWCHRHFHLPHSRKFTTHRVILANASHLIHWKRKRKSGEGVLLVNLPACFFLLPHPVLKFLRLTSKAIADSAPPCQFLSRAKPASMIHKQTALSLCLHCHGCFSSWSFQAAAQVPNLIDILTDSSSSYYRSSPLTSQLHL